MASAFAHAITAVALGKVFSFKSPGWKFWILGMVCAVIPDADAIGFWYGVEYGSFWGHRGFTHSLVFAALLALVVVLAFYWKELKQTYTALGLWLYFFLCTASHPLLDAMTTGGKGVAFFSPFDNERYFLPWRPIKVSPISIERFFSERGWQVIQSELVWVFLPCLVMIAVMYFIRKRK